MLYYNTNGCDNNFNNMKFQATLKNNYYSMKKIWFGFFEKKILIVICTLLLSLSSICANNPTFIASKMKALFTQILKDTYGEYSENELYKLFLTDYTKDRKGEVELTINVESLNEINDELFSDSVYYYFYPRLLFLDSYEDLYYSDVNKSQIINNSIYFFGKKDHTTSKFGIYLSNRYLNEIVIRNPNIKALNDIYNYSSAMGIVSYFMIADIVLTNFTDIENEVLKELTAVVFWKYLCDKKGISFYK